MLEEEELSSSELGSSPSELLSSELASRCRRRDEDEEARCDLLRVENSVFALPELPVFTLSCLLVKGFALWHWAWE